MYSWSQPGLWWLAVAYTVRLASSNWWEKECYIASRVAAHLLMRHSERQFVAPLHQSPLSILCIYGCIVRMCLRWSSFKAKHKAHFLVRMRHSPCPTTHTRTHTYKNHTHRAADADTYLRETRVALALTSTVLLLPVLSYASWPVGEKQADFSFTYRISKMSETDSGNCHSVKKWFLNIFFKIHFAQNQLNMSCFHILILQFSHNW